MKTGSRIKADAAKAELLRRVKQSKAVRVGSAEGKTISVQSRKALLAVKGHAG